MPPLVSHGVSGTGTNTTKQGTTTRPSSSLSACQATMGPLKNREWPTVLGTVLGKEEIPVGHARRQTCRRRAAPSACCVLKGHAANFGAIRTIMLIRGGPCWEMIFLVGSPRLVASSGGLRSSRRPGAHDSADLIRQAQSSSKGPRLGMRIRPLNAAEGAEGNHCHKGCLGGREKHGEHMPKRELDL